MEIVVVEEAAVVAVDSVVVEVVVFMDVFLMIVRRG